jgi:hypothetical protein
MARNRFLVATLVALGVIFVASAAWIGIRGSLAKAELDHAAPLANAVQHGIAAGKPAEALAASRDLSARARNAVDLTGDPIWLAAEAVPWVGDNLAAVRQASEATRVVAERVVAPLTHVASVLDESSFRPSKGVVNLQPITAAQGDLTHAQQALNGARKQVAAIRTSGTIGQISAAITRLGSALDKAAVTVDSVRNGVLLLPLMLGSEAPRNYLLLIQNPAELRASGGIAGALALIHTDHGRISLGTQASTTSFPQFKTPVQTLPAEAQGLYGTIAAQYIQNVNLTPRFDLTGSLAREMWRQRFGTTVDGVVAVDPVALGYLLGATGPIQLSSGEELNAGNAVQLLVSETYKRYPDPAAQDAFFARAAAAVFERIAEGRANAASLLRAFAKAGDERRILIWSARDAEQAILTPTTLAGGLPTSTPARAGMGVYLNDATGAKMDYYLDVTVSVASSICRVDGHPNARVTITLKNNAPADAATSLPAYVTGAGDFGVAPGTIRTRVSVYGPVGSLLVATTSNGADFPALAATDGGHAVSQFAVDLAPGKSSQVSVDMLNMGQFTSDVYAVVTPALNSRVVKDLVAPCTGTLN